MALNTRTPFTRKAALAAGIGIAEVTSQRYQRLFHGIYLAAGVPVTPAVRARAALLVAPPGSYVSHHSAVQLWGGWAPQTSDVHIATPSPLSRSERAGIVAHVGSTDVVRQQRSGLPVISPARAFLDLAAFGVSLVDLVISGDSLVRAKVVTPEQLVEAADHWEGRHRATAVRAARLIRTGVDSVMESRVRMLLVLGGMPEPVVNLILRDRDGNWLYRFELSYRDLKIAIEYDGLHHLTPDQRRRDLARREQLEHQGWLFVVLVSEDVFDFPDQVLSRVRQARGSRGCRLRRRKVTPEWRRAFPGRDAA